MKRIFLVLVVVLLWMGSADAAKYVDPVGGSDANPGSLASPYKSLEYTVENGGDAQIYLLSGTYGGAELGASTNIWKSGTDHVITSPANYIIEVYTGQTVVISQPSDTSSNLFRLLGNLTIKGASGSNKLSVTNTSADATLFFNIQSAAAYLTLQDVDADWNNAAYYFLNVSQLLAANNTVHLIRCRVTDTSATHAFIRQNTPTPQYTTIIAESCIFTGMGWIWNDGGTGTTRWILKNCTADALKTSAPFFMATNTLSYGSTKNCIFNLDATTFLYAYYVDATVAWGGWTNWDIQHNGIYKPHSDVSGTDLNYLCTAVTQLFPLDETNFYLDPEFVNAPTDYTLGATSYLNGRGVAAALPTGGDYFGNPWNCTTGADMGAIANPIPAPLWPTISSGVVMVGDSIAKGTADRLVSDWSAITVLGDPVAGNDYTGSALPGSHLFSCKWLVDRAAVNWGAKKAVFLSGHNTFAGASTTPANLTASQAATDIIVAMKKAAYWGMTPINLGEGGIPTGRDDNTTRPIAFNNAVDAAIVTENLGYRTESWLDRMRFNESWASAVSGGGYYQTGGLNANIHPDAEGYELIASIVSDVVNGYYDTYYVSQSGVPVVGTQYGPGTSTYPLSIAGLNAQAVGGGHVDLPYRRVGKNIKGMGTISTALTTPAAGASGKPFTIIEGGAWTGGWIVNKQYWQGQFTVINSGSSTAVEIDALYNKFYQLVVNTSTGSGFDVNESTEIKGCIMSSTSTGTNMDIASGKVVTGGHNCFANMAHPSSGYAGVGDLDNTDPIFSDVSGGDFSIASNSPCIMAGPKAGDVGLAGKRTDGVGNTYSFAPYDRLNIGIDQAHSDADDRPAGSTVIKGN